MQTPALVPRWHVGQAMSGLEGEFFEDFHVASLGNAEHFVGLKAQSPLRMLKAVLHRLRRVQGPIGAIHRLQEEMLEREVLEQVGTSPLLRKHELEFIPSSQRKICPRLRTHADPVKIGGGRFRAVCLNRHLEVFGV